MTSHDLPLWVRVIVVAAIFLLAVDVVVIIPILVGYRWKIDPGLATITGAVLGLGIVGWQARKGFANLVASQKNQAELDRAAREHQLSLDRSKAEDERQYERRLLMESIRAELVGLMDQASHASAWASTLALTFEAMAREKVPNTTKELKFPGHRTPVFDNNIGRLGLLGVSIAADVIMVCTKAGKDVEIKFESPPALGMVAVAYKGIAQSMNSWHDELHHVAMRLIAAETGAPDPGTLISFRQSRQKT